MLLQAVTAFFSAVLFSPKDIATEHEAKCFYIFNIKKIVQDKSFENLIDSDVSL